MRFSFVSTLLLMALHAFAIAQAQSPAMDWHMANEFSLEGKGWRETESPYVRFTAKAKEHVSASVWNLSQHSAGICVRFQSDAPTVWARWSLTSAELAMPHMPATGVSGVDLYGRDKRGKWVFVGNGRPTLVEGNVASFGVDNGVSEMREYLLYLPLYNGVKSLEIGVPQGKRVQNVLPRPREQSQAVVYYGTSIAQGGCASRPGMAFTAILGRDMDRPIINLGFSGSALLEPEVAQLIAELDPAVFVIDALWNAGSLPEKELASRIENFARTLRAKHPETPLLFVGQSLVHPTHIPSNASKIQEQVIKMLIKEGVRGLYLLDGEKLFGIEGEGTVDGVHPNDLGMMTHAKALFPVLEKIVRSRPRD